MKKVSWEDAISKTGAIIAFGAFAASFLGIIVFMLWAAWQYWPPIPFLLVGVPLSILLIVKYVSPIFAKDHYDEFTE